MKIAARSSKTGLILDNDPERVRANASFMANKLRAVIDVKKTPFEGGPFRTTTTNGEASLATILAFAIVTAELVEHTPPFGHEAGEHEDDGSYDDELDPEDVARLLRLIELDIERWEKGKSPHYPTDALTSTLTRLREELHVDGTEAKGDSNTLARIETALDKLGESVF